MVVVVDRSVSPSSTTNWVIWERSRERKGEGGRKGEREREREREREGHIWKNK